MKSTLRGSAGRELLHALGQRAHAAHADDGNGRQHVAHGLADGLCHRCRIDRLALDGLRVVHEALGREHALGEARARKVGAGATYRLFEHRVADQVVVAFLAVHQQVVRVEVKAHVGRKVRQPVDRGLQAHELPVGQECVQALCAGFRAAKGLEAEARGHRCQQALDDGLGRHAVRDERQARQLDERQVSERQRRREAERHALGHGHAVVAHQVRDDAAFAMRRLLVFEFHGRPCKVETGRPSASE